MWRLTKPYQLDAIHKEEQQKRRIERQNNECNTNPEDGSETQIVEENANGEVTIYESKSCGEGNVPCEKCGGEGCGVEEDEEFQEDGDEEYSDDEDEEGSCSDMQDGSNEDYDDSNYDQSIDEEDHDEEFEIAYRRHLIRHIQFSINKKDPFVISPKYFQRFIAKSHNDFCELKHANTAKSACDEIVSCIGEILKEKLLNLWKVKKSDDLIHYLFLKLCIDCMIENIESHSLKEKYDGNLQKKMIEDFVTAMIEDKNKKKEAQKIKKQKKKQLKKAGKGPKLSSENIIIKDTN